MQQNLLDPNPKAAIRVYAVWFKMYPGDARERWHQDLLPDSRVTHFWDDTKAVGRMYGQLERRMMARRAPQSKDIEGPVLWDSYLLYGPDARWSDQPPDVISWGSTILLSRDTLARDLRALVSPH